jgi:hypothetical protein
MAENCGVGYDEMMRAAASGDYIHMGENERYKEYFWKETDRFWEHYEVATGKKASKAMRANFLFSCSC